MFIVYEILGLIALAILVVVVLIRLTNLMEWVSGNDLKASKIKNETQECGTPIDELGNFPAINNDYSFMNDLDDYIMADESRGGHYIKITLNKKDDLSITKKIEAATFEKLMEKTRIWCLENNK